MGAITSHPPAVLERQMRHAEIGATLDFPIPPKCESALERNHRFKATLANAEWALSNNRRTDLLLCQPSMLGCRFGPRSRRSLCTDEPSRSQIRWSCHRWNGAAPAQSRVCSRNQEAVRVEWSGPIHVFGVGNPEMVRKLLRMGADSTDSVPSVARS